MKHLVLLMVGLAIPAAEAEPLRLLLAVGSNAGSEDDEVLQYANHDARRFKDVMVELGHISGQRAYVLEDATADEVRAALTELRGRAEELAEAQQRTQLFVYVSAHARGGQLRLRGTAMSLEELRERVGRIATELRVIVLDTCESGAVVRQKGGTRTRSFDVQLERVPLKGVVVISSSGPGETAEEWGSLGSSLFTHHLLTGLRGDADASGDGLVTLSEVYAYANDRTVASAARSQHPMADIDVTGSGELVLTNVNDSRTALVFPRAAEGHFIVASQPRPHVVLEVDKRSGRTLRLAVPAGRYQVRKRLGATVGLLEVELAFGGEGVVDEGRLERRHFAEVALKGAGSFEARPSTVYAFGSVTSAPIAETGARWIGGVGYRWTRGALWVGGRVGGTATRYRGRALSISERSLGAQASVGWRWLQWASVVPFLGGGVDVGLVVQDVVRDNEQVIQSVFKRPPLPQRVAPTVGPVAIVGMEVPLPAHFVVTAQLECRAAWLPNEGVGPPWSPGIAGSLVLGWRF